MRRTHFALLLAAMICFLVAARAPARVWTDKSGSFRVDAELIEMKDGVVRLKKPDGGIKEIPVNRLSPADHDFLQKASTPAPAAADPAAVASGAPADKVPPAKAVPLSIGVKTFEELEKLVNRQFAIASVIRLYQLFLDDPDVKEPEKASARQRLPHWDALAKGNAVRIGSKWITDDALQQYAKNEDRLLEEAWRMIDVGNEKLAEDRLQQASKANPDGVRADYFLGLYYALKHRDAAGAGDHFNECVRRRIGNVESLSHEEKANLIGAINNLALTEIRQRKYDSAIKYWRMAAKLAPPPAEMIQNVGRFVYLADASSHLGISKAQAKSAGDLYADLALKNNAARFSRSTGWLYLQLFSQLSTSARSQLTSSAPPNAAPAAPAAAAAGKPAAGKRILVGSASGFAIQPTHVVTNHHVVKGADKLTLALRGAPDKEFDARVVADSPADDLAVLECADLHAVPLPFDAKPPRLGTDICLLGYPETTALGNDLKATRGSISGLPNPSVDNYLLYDAVTNAGNSGGPVCDQNGNVVAVHSAGLGAVVFGSANAGKLGAGIPAARTVAFLKKQLPKLADVKPGAAERPWADMVEAVGASTYFIRIYVTPASNALSKKLAAAQGNNSSSPGAKASWDAFEDPWCMFCNGRGQVECPVRSCARGMVPSQKSEVAGANPVTGQPIITSTPTRVLCATCGGKGKVSCKSCRGGVDPSVLAGH